MKIEKDINTLNTKGIIFYSIPYQDDDLILHVFTNDLGLVKAFVKNGIKYKKQNLYSAFYELDWVFKQTRGELLFPRDSALLEQNLHLRQDFSLIQTASKLLQAVKATHPYWKASPETYRLLKFFLQKLSNGQDFKKVLSSFYLKLLGHEGLLSLEGACQHCGESQKELHLTPLGTFCSLDLKKSNQDPSLVFSHEESLACLSLASVKSWQSLEDHNSIPPQHSDKILRFFKYLAQY
jgi:DNA repair protein RecO